jgi:hypothetical protein
MPRKIHMQDQVFDNVASIMGHKPKAPVHINVAGVSITLQFPANKGRRQHGPSQSTSLVH